MELAAKKQQLPRNYNPLIAKMSTLNKPARGIVVI